jgi:hypothetical protein
MARTKSSFSALAAPSVSSGPEDGRYQPALMQTGGTAWACEHAFVMFSDALLLLFEMADREDERFQAAAARWHARFVLEADLPLREAEGVMTLLCRLRGADRHVVRRRLLLSVERAGLTTREISPRA